MRFQAMFHMSNDSGLFRTEPGDGLLPLYEAKMIWQYDHRFGSYEGRSERGFHQPGRDANDAISRSCLAADSFYWVSAAEVSGRLGDDDRSG